MTRIRRERHFHVYIRLENIGESEIWRKNSTAKPIANQWKRKQPERNAREEQRKKKAGESGDESGIHPKQDNSHFLSFLHKRRTEAKMLV